MRLGEIIAETFAALLLICILAVVFFLGGKPFWPEHQAKMTILLPPDAMTTGSVKRSTYPNLPDTVDPKLIQPRPVPSP